MSEESKNFFGVFAKQPERVVFSSIRICMYCRGGCPHGIMEKKNRKRKLGFKEKSWTISTESCVGSKKLVPVAGSYVLSVWLWCCISTYLYLTEEASGDQQSGLKTPKPLSENPTPMETVKDGDVEATPMETANGGEETASPAAVQTPPPPAPPRYRLAVYVHLWVSTSEDRCLCAYITSALKVFVNAVGLTALSVTY